MTVTEWRGLRVGDVYEISCFPGHAKTIDRINVTYPRGEWRGVQTIEWAVVWGIKPDKYRTRSMTELHIDAAGNPVWRRYAWDDGHWRYTEHPVVIVARAYRTPVQLALFEEVA